MGSNTSLFVAICASVLHYVIDIFGRDCGVRIGGSGGGTCWEICIFGGGGGNKRPGAGVGGAGRPE